MKLCQEGWHRPALSLFAKVSLAFSCALPKISCFQNFLLTPLDFCGNLSQRSIAIQLFNATATALNCISQICCFHVALISCLAIKAAIILRSSNSGLPTADPPCGCTVPSGRTALPGCPARPRCRPTAPPPDPHRLRCASGGR